MHQASTEADDGDTNSPLPSEEAEAVVEPGSGTPQPSAEVEGSSEVPAGGADGPVPPGETPAEPLVPPGGAGSNDGAGAPPGAEDGPTPGTPPVVVPPSAPDPIGSGDGEPSGVPGEGEGGAGTSEEPGSGPTDPEPEEPPVPGDGEPGGGGDGNPDDGPVAPPADPTIPGGLGSFKLAIIGSSTASGEGASSYAATWVGQLEAELQAAVATSVTLDNLAVGGYTADDLMPGSGGKGSIDEAIRARPDLIVVALAGSNDLTPEITTEKFMSQLETLRDTAKAASIPAFFFSTLPKSFSTGERELLRLWARTMADTFSSCWIPGSAAPFAPCFIDVFDKLADSSLGLAAPLDSGDGNHPNDAGHAVLYKSAEAIIKPYVCAKTQCK